MEITIMNESEDRTRSKEPTIDPSNSQSDDDLPKIEPYDGEKPVSDGNGHGRNGGIYD
jgi:hypothetical protein